MTRSEEEEEFFKRADAVMTAKQQLREAGHALQGYAADNMEELMAKGWISVKINWYAVHMRDHPKRRQ